MTLSTARTMSDAFGNALNIAVIDTMTWNFYKGIGWPYTSESDTFDVTTRKYVKRWGWNISASGHDDNRDYVALKNASTVKAWRYYVYTNYNPSTDTGKFWPLGRAGNSWFPGIIAGKTGFMTDTFTLTVRYDDADGADLFANQPEYFNNLISVVLYGRDTAVGQGDFPQYVFWDEVPTGQSAGSGVSKKNLINSFSTGSLGRWTPRKVIQFYLKFER